MQTMKDRSNLKLSITALTTAIQTPEAMSASSPQRVERLNRRVTVKSFDPGCQWIQKHWLYPLIERDLEQVRRKEGIVEGTKSMDTARIDQALSRHLKREQQKSQFQRKFPSKPSPTAKGLKLFVSETEVEKDKALLRQTMNNPQTRSKIYENSLLQDYYLKDLRDLLQKKKLSTEYLRRDFDIFRHRKLTKNPEELERLYMKHDQTEVSHMKLLNYVKNQKQIKDAVKKAKKNLTYRKQLNLQRINYIIECMVARPLTEPPNKPKNPLPPQYTSILKRLFFRYANTQGGQSIIYTFVSPQRLEVLMKRLNLPIEPEFHRQLFKKLTKHKTQQCLFYLDFVEFLTKLGQKTYKIVDKHEALIKLLDSCIRSRTEMYISYVEQLYNSFIETVQNFLEKSKTAYCIQTIFNNFQQKLQYGKLMSLPVLIEALTQFKILEVVQKQRAIFQYKYVCLRDEGITCEELIKVFCLLALTEELQLSKIKAQTMKRICYAMISRNDPKEVVGHLKHYFSDKLKLIQHVLQ